MTHGNDAEHQPAAGVAHLQRGAHNLTGHDEQLTRALVWDGERAASGALIWEGVVDDICGDHFNSTRCQSNFATRDPSFDTVCFELAEVSEADLPLVVPGARFWWVQAMALRPSGARWRVSGLEFERIERRTGPGPGDTSRDGSPLESIGGVDLLGQPVECSGPDGSGARPVNMILHCPECHDQHVDAPEPETGWTNPPHRSHLCHACGVTWRPADVPTYGVEHIETRGFADIWPEVEGRDLDIAELQPEGYDEFLPQCPPDTPCSDGAVAEEAPAAPPAPAPPAALYRYIGWVFSEAESRPGDEGSTNAPYSSSPPDRWPILVKARQAPAPVEIECHTGLEQLQAGDWIITATTEWSQGKVAVHVGDQFFCKPSIFPRMFVRADALTGYVEAEAIDLADAHRPGRLGSRWRALPGTAGRRDLVEELPPVGVRVVVLSGGVDPPSAVTAILLPPPSTDTDADSADDSPPIPKWRIGQSTQGWLPNSTHWTHLPEL